MKKKNKLSNFHLCRKFVLVYSNWKRPLRRIFFTTTTHCWIHWREFKWKNLINSFKHIFKKNIFIKFTYSQYFTNTSQVEDKGRRYYETGETLEFERVENEWPVFYLFMIIDGMFKDDKEQVHKYQVPANIEIIGEAAKKVPFFSGPTTKAFTPPPLSV